MFETISVKFITNYDEISRKNSGKFLRKSVTVEKIWPDFGKILE